MLARTARGAWARAPSRLLTPEWRPWLALGAAMAAAATFLWLEGRDLVFYADEWDFLMHRRGHDPDAFLRPQNGHLVLVPVLIYKALFETFGADSYAPFRVVSIGAYLLCAGLFFRLLRPRVGDGLAVLATVLLLFLGTAWEQLLSGIGTIIFISLAAGLGMLLALERGTRRGDAAACALLATSLASFSYGLAFALAAAVEIFLRPRPWRRAWVVAAPLALYGIWRLAYGESQVSDANIPGVPRFVADSLGAALASLTGLYRSPDQASGANFDTTWGPPLAAVFVAVVVVGMRHRERRSVRLWAGIALALAFWTSLALVDTPDRVPQASRYQFSSAVFVLLVVAELVRGVRPSRNALVAIACGVGVLVAINVSTLSDGADILENKARIGRAELTALELARGKVSPTFTPEPGASPLLQDHFFVYVDAGSYLRAASDFGSPAYTPSELAGASTDARSAADLVLVGALAVSPRRARPGDAGGTPPAVERSAANAAVSGRGRCIELRPAGETAASFVLRLPPGGVLVRADQRTSVGLALRRFATGYAVKLPALGPGRVTALPIPVDGSPRPWRLRLDRVAVPVFACGLSLSGSAS